MYEQIICEKDLKIHTKSLNILKIIKPMKGNTNTNHAERAHN